MIAKLNPKNDILATVGVPQDTLCLPGKPFRRFDLQFLRRRQVLSGNLLIV